MNQIGLIEREIEASSPRTMASILADSIRDDIISGVLPPESKLRLKDLATRYAAGVIPLREALSRLAMTGFVRVEDQRGFSVTGISVEELRDITSTRQRIETDALRNAIANGDIEWEGRILSSFHRLSKLSMKGPGSAPSLNREWEEAHDNFHHAILSGCTSRWLIHFAHILRDQTARYRHLSVKTEIGEKRDVAAEHKAILDAILARDGELSCALLSQHFETTTQLVLARSR
jgi:DNA-binding GntR family transcriptional regulator